MVYKRLTNKTSTRNAYAQTQSRRGPGRQLPRILRSRYVGRIFYVGARAPKDTLWSLEFYEWQGSDGPQYGNVANLEAAKAACRTAWEKAA